MNSSKVVISGATGWLGKELIKVLSSEELNKLQIIIIYYKY
jgi:N-acetyl-gamma-glutamylphosphate reductase